MLSEFRARLIAGGREARLLDAMLEQFQALGLLTAGGTQRTDSTHVLAAVRQLNRLEVVGEPLRPLLNSLAVAAPEWRRVPVPPAWYDRYSTRCEATRLPETERERQALAAPIGADGQQLLTVLADPETPDWLRQLPAVESARQIWHQQYLVQDGQVLWRPPHELPPGKQLIESPFDLAARFSSKRSTRWVGDTVHLTECCDPDRPHLITQVVTTPATTGDVAATAAVQAARHAKQLTPGRHVVDGGYTDAELLEHAQRHYGIDLFGPVRDDISWQARASEGFALADFELDWDGHQARCPHGQGSRLWSEGGDDRGQAVITIHCAQATCLACPVRARWTKAATTPRKLKVRPHPVHEALPAARHRQTTAAFQDQYKVRAGVEGTISHGTRTFGLRRSRSIGLAKTHFQHVATAAAINLIRFHAWREERPFAPTRVSAFKALQPKAA